MKFFFNIILKIIDFFYQRKIINFFKNYNVLEYNILIDVGAHKGETIVNFLRNFQFQKIYSFEASKKTFEVLKVNIAKIKNDYKKTNIEIFNKGVGSSNKRKTFNELPDSNSSTFNPIDQNSSYFRRKNKILSFFFKKDFFIEKSIISQIKLSDFISEKNIKDIDILKIDTEGYELEVLKGLENSINIVKFIYFEHHYDNMIQKDYKFSDIHDFLVLNRFTRVFKIKMPLRKSFDYIYIRKTV
jgi:FkbM family methyltransferase